MCQNSERRHFLNAILACIKFFFFFLFGRKLLEYYNLEAGKDMRKLENKSNNCPMTYQLHGEKDK